MEADAGRRSVISPAIFWIFLAVSAAALGLGWAAGHTALDAPMRDELRDLHVSLGLAGAGLILLQLLLALAGLALGAAQGSDGPEGPEGSATGWRASMSFALRQFVYLSFLAVIVTGAGGALFAGEQIFFFDFPLPYWNGANPSLAETLRGAHPVAAHVLAGAIAAYLILGVVGFVASPAPSRAPALAPPPPASPTSIATMIADGLAHNFRVLGGAAFWVQLFLGVVSALLLAFGFVGHTVSPGATVFGDAIYWASAAIGLLVPGVLFGFAYLKTARRILDRPERYLGHERRAAFWFVGVGAAVSIVGALIAFAGVGLSVALLIGKTVSQPPGIAITDPTKIIRALDVFVLLVNFNLLFAHFIGFGVAGWLSNSAWKARHQYVVATEAAN